MNGFYLQEHQVLSLHLEAMNKKLALEIKIRDVDMMRLSSSFFLLVSPFFVHTDES